MFGIFDPIVSYRKLLADAGHSVEGAENGTVQSLRVDNVKVDLVNYPYPWMDAFPLRGLMYFDDAEEDPMPEMFDGDLTWENVKKTVVAATRKYVLT